MDALDESLGQKSVFDRLTNYGKIQGLFMQNGNLYANASYVKSGVLDANLVKAGILTDEKGLQYWDMTTGEFRLAGTSTIAGNKASDLATTTAAQRLTSPKPRRRPKIRRRHRLEHARVREGRRHKQGQRRAISGRGRCYQEGEQRGSQRQESRFHGRDEQGERGPRGGEEGGSRRRHQHARKPPNRMPTTRPRAM